MAPKATERDIERRRAARATLDVAFRMVAAERPSEPIDGRTLDVSERGIGVKFGPSGVDKLDMLLETLVEDRAVVEVTLRLPEGSVSAKGHLMWWGLLGEPDGYSIRGGVLLSEGWSPEDWQLIEENLKSV